MPTKPKFHIQKPVYAMASVDGLSAEITMYGDIYESKPTDWWGNPIEGQYITLDEFLDDLKQVETCKDITIRMSSYGGDAGVSNLIHNRLRELARNGAKLTCIVDGAAMSGGSLIMCACDTVKVNPSSLIMIHKCWTTAWGSFNAEDLRQAAEQLDAWDKMQVECYKRKTGLSSTVLSHMMAETTYMTGREAVEKGFADELIEDAEPISVAASADGRSIFVRGRQLHLAPGMFAPDSIPTVKPGEAGNEPSNTATMAAGNNNTPEDTGSEGGNSMTIEELRAQNPEQVAQIEAAARASVETAAAVNEAVEAERQRIQQIDEIAALYADELVQEAKYGENTCSAQELAYRAAQQAAKKGASVMAAMQQDAKASGAAEVKSEPGALASGSENSPSAMEAAAKQAVANFFKSKEEK